MSINSFEEEQLHKFYELLHIYIKHNLKIEITGSSNINDGVGKDEVIVNVDLLLNGKSISQSTAHIGIDHSHKK